MPKNPNDIGALWLKESKNGAKYLSGTVEVGGQKIGISVFKSKFYEPGSNKPMYQILKQGPRQTQKPNQESDIPF